MMKMRTIKSKIVIIIFLSLIFYPVGGMLIEKIYNISLDVNLNGYFEEYQMPDLSFYTFSSGKYQRGFSTWIENNFASHGLVTKIYNQIQYTIWNQGAYVIGKNKDIYDEKYIEADLAIGKNNNYSIRNKQAEMETYVEQLIQLEKNLKKQEIEMIFYITPSKSNMDMENIPQFYVVQDKGYDSASEYLKQLLKDTNLTWIDSGDYLQGEEYPIFYKTGIHWSRPAEQEISKLIMELIAEKVPESGKKIQLKELCSSNIPYWRDDDVLRVLNLLWNNYDEVYYEYDTMPLISNNCSDLKILIHGDSFCQGFVYDCQKNSLINEINTVLYDTMWIDSEGNTVGIKDFSELDIEYLIENTDVVIIELNEALASTYSSGFIGCLNEYLLEKEEK